MNESPEREHKEFRQRIIANSLQKLFDDLKEHLGSLRRENYDALSLRFSGEVDDYVGELVKQMAASRVVRKQRIESKRNDFVLS